LRLRWCVASSSPAWARTRTLLIQRHGGNEPTTVKMPAFEGDLGVRAASLPTDAGVCRGKLTQTDPNCYGSYNSAGLSPVATARKIYGVRPASRLRTPTCAARGACLRSKRSRVRIAPGQYKNSLPPPRARLRWMFHRSPAVPTSCPARETSRSIRRSGTNHSRTTNPYSTPAIHGRRSASGIATP
jgi:hypothetical protein